MDVLNENLIRIIISNPRVSSEINKIKIRLVSLKSVIMYQVTEYVGPQVIHHNYTKEEVISYVENQLQSTFKQCEIIASEWTVIILAGKKGNITINRKKSIVKKIENKDLKPDLLSHNRSKNYILKEGTPVPFLIDLGVMTKTGEIVRTKYDKFRQINRFLEFISDIQKELPTDREIQIIDFGCGKSYLTFAMYYYLRDLCGKDVAITGLDLKKDVIEKCNHLSNKYGYSKLDFKLGNIADYTEHDQVDMVVTLHACDTATDYAIAKAVSWNAKVILSVPCCQHELNKQLQNELIQPILNYGILQDRFAAIMTDSIRAEMLKIKGYKTDILEFIDMEHTPKNLLIRAIKGNEKGNKEALKKMINEFNVQPTIVTLLK